MKLKKMVKNNRGQYADPLISFRNKFFKADQPLQPVVAEGAGASNQSNEKYSCDACQEEFTNLELFSHHLDFHEAIQAVDKEKRQFVKNSYVPRTRVVYFDQDDRGVEASLQEAEAVVVRNELID